MYCTCTCIGAPTILNSLVHVHSIKLYSVRALRFQHDAKVKARSMYVVNDMWSQTVNKAFLLSMMYVSAVLFVLCASSWCWWAALINAVWCTALTQTTLCATAQAAVNILWSCGGSELR